MKFSWISVMLLSFGLFICFIGYFVVKINTDPQLKYHMVIPNYYEEELKENQKNKANKNAFIWAKDMTHKMGDNSLTLYPLPENQLFKVTGYRPSDPTKDFYYEVKNKMGDNSIGLPNKNMEKGVWQLTLEWEDDNKDFRIKYKLNIK